mmetsp:Transcript_107589/g.160934  ORF Transcript_107589/g.160934 Transcript_107589/m.160934 type:complete len:450 (-) Transcript_107589:62-1411(-)
MTMTPLRVVQFLVFLLPSVCVDASSSSSFHDISLGGGSSTTIWACLTRNDNITQAIDCFIPSEGGFNGGISNPARASLSGDYTQVAVGGAGSSSSVWSCAPITDVTGSRIDCLLASDGFSVEAGSEYSVRGTLAGDYTEVSVGGGGDSTVWACAIRKDSGNVVCFLPRDAYSSEDGILFVRASLEGDYSGVSVGGGGSSSIWACATKTDGTGVDCIIPNDYVNGGDVDVRASLVGAYDQVSLGGGRSSLNNWACARKTDGSQLDCFVPSEGYTNGGVYEVKASLVGDYRQVDIGGAGSVTIWACAPKSDGSQIDCFLPVDGFTNEGIYEIRASLLGDYTKVSVGGGGSSTVWACALRASGAEIDCFTANDGLFNVGVYEVATTYFADPPTMAPTISFPPSPMPTTAPPTGLIPDDNSFDDGSTGCSHRVLSWFAVATMTLGIMITLSWW